MFVNTKVVICSRKVGNAFGCPGNNMCIWIQGSTLRGTELKYIMANLMTKGCYSFKVHSRPSNT